MKTGVIIVAGGSGSRMCSDLPKQFMLLGGRPVLMRCVERFGEALPEARIVVVLPASELGRWDTLCTEYTCTVSHTVCCGGSNRFESVRSGLSHIGDVDFIAVQDGVRALLSVDMIRKTMEVAERCGTAIPATHAVDSYRLITADGSMPIDRSELRAVQTPQIFAREIIMNAYRQPYLSSFTDDASVVESSGVGVTLCLGEQSNIKITTPLDMVIAEAILRSCFESRT